jgi:diguanylate cyclase (GGDEF)-like protein
LQTHSHIPRLDKALSFILIAFVAVIISSPVVSLSYSAPALSILAVILAGMVMTIGIILSLKGHRTAVIYLISWLFFILGALVLTARNFGLIPNTILTQYAIFIGSALEMLLLSFALVQRIDQVQKHSQYLITANSELKDQESSLRQLAHYDALTGLSNRTLIMEKFALLLAHSKRNDTKVAILFLDLDGFKPINDLYGHHIGDDILIIMADRLRSLLRNSDTIGRIGGDEFIVLVEKGDGDFNPQEVANKIKKAIAEPISIMGDNLQLGVSIGAAIYPDNGKDIATLVSLADTAMYIDKAYRHH